MMKLYRVVGRLYLGIGIPLRVLLASAMPLITTLIFAAGCSQAAVTPPPQPTPPPVVAKPPPVLSYVNVSGDLPANQDQWMDNITGGLGWCYDVTAFNSRGAESIPSSPAACRFAVDGRNIVQWVAPTENTDGSPLTDLAGFRVYRKSQ